MSHVLEEAYAIVAGAKIVPTVEHLKAIYRQLHPAPSQSWCDYCYRLEEPDNLSMIDGQRYCGRCAKEKVE